ncbi:hypothetical protein GC088_14105 [Arthrobacter sp. JZ12]|uniref:hypothetical protein n=1 Tax=Arthrobacter sp. JZ12 TaxID=2654190 RepID=UPI002B4600F9|nr:hypothetical protein [Arthrobacter sp. JZ12]WRH26087.1 hypothetical protein GC088_14105 [Arthrobacter sp. JZ12]
MKLGLVLHELHRSENDLALELLEASERHKVDHEIYHVARDLAKWSQDHVRAIAEIGKQYGQDLDPEPRHEFNLAEKIRERGSDLLGRKSAPALLMLRDLREIYMKASGVSVDWEMLAQAAQGIKHTDLLDVAARCHPETLRQMRWANSMLKVNSTQILVS